MAGLGKKHECFTEGCHNEAEWIPHIKILPPKGLEATHLSISLSMLICTDCRDKATFDDYMPPDAWDVVATIFSLGPAEDPSIQMKPERKNAALVFHTMAEVEAFIGMENPTIQ